MRSLAERIFERRTVAFVTGFDSRHDLSVVIISFEPASGGADAARASASVTGRTLDCSG
jgi:hypothetical protein